jgi:hypothetical protein
MILIRGAVSDALFERVYNYDKQFRLRIAQNPIRSWSQIDGNLCFRFIARGTLGGQLSQQPRIEYGFVVILILEKDVYWVHQNVDVTARQDLCTEAPIFFPLNFD